MEEQDCCGGKSVVKQMLEHPALIFLFPVALVITACLAVYYKAKEYLKKRKD